MEACQALLSVGDDLDRAVTQWLGDPAAEFGPLEALLQQRARLITSLAGQSLGPTGKAKLLEQDTHLKDRLEQARQTLLARRRRFLYRGQGAKNLPLFFDRST